MGLAHNPISRLERSRLAQDQSTIDATKQPSPPARGRGPFPGSATPGHSAGLPIRLELSIPTGELRPDGTTLVDFVITNVGTEPITLPSSVNQNIDGTDVLTLWLTSDAIKDVMAYTKRRVFRLEIVGTSAELYGRVNVAQSFIGVAPNKTIRVHANSRVGLQPGTHSFTAHAELARLSNGASELVGTADSETLTRTLSTTGPTAR